MKMDEHSPGQPWTILSTLQWTADYFKGRGIENPRTDAEILMAEILGCERIDLYMHHDQPLQAEELHRFKQCIKRRVQREPVAYILGSKEFWSLEFDVTGDVLIPRPETEGLVEAALQLWDQDTTINVLEMGTGSGIIAISLAHERHSWRILATDISEKAIEMARLNAGKHQLEERITWGLGDWYGAIETETRDFDLIVTNPPYINESDLSSLAPEICEFEPQLALDGGPDGLTCIRHIVQRAPEYLKPGGWLLLEIGFDQGEAVKRLARESGAYQQVEILKDYAGLDRIARLQI